MNAAEKHRLRTYPNQIKDPPLPSFLDPHGWRKFEQAQSNMMRHRCKRGRRNYRRLMKWVRAMGYWATRIYGGYDKNFWQ